MKMKMMRLWDDEEEEEVLIWYGMVGELLWTTFSNRDKEVAMSRLQIIKRIHIPWKDAEGIGSTGSVFFPQGCLF